MMKNILEVLPNAERMLDDAITTDEERLQSVDNRHAVDSATDYWLTKAIRPLLSLAYTALHIYLMVTGIGLGLVDYTTAILSTAAIVSAIIGFYFSGRTKVKVVDIQAKAAIKVTELKLKAAIVQERRDKKLQRRAERKALKQTKSDEKLTNK